MHRPRSRQRKKRRISFESSIYWLLIAKHRIQVLENSHIDALMSEPKENGAPERPERKRVPRRNLSANNSPAPAPLAPPPTSPSVASTANSVLSDVRAQLFEASGASSRSASVPLASPDPVVTMNLLEDRPSSTDLLAPAAMRVLEDEIPMPSIPDIDLDNLDITTEDVDFDDLQGYLEKTLTAEFVANNQDILTSRDRGERKRHRIEEQLHQLEQAQVLAYVRRAADIVGRYRLLRECDATLGSIEGHLAGFADELGATGAEIRGLQDAMDVLKSRTDNRRTVQTRLEDFVTTLTLPPTLSDAINTAPVGPAFLAAVTELHARLQFMQGLPAHTPALGDVTIDFNSLRVKAARKLRDAMMDTLARMKAPDSRAAADFGPGEQELLQYRAGMAFLRDQAAQTGAEVRDKYVEIVSAEYAQQIKACKADLRRFQADDQAGKSDVIGVDDTAKRNLFSPQKVKTRPDAFALNDRDAILTNLTAPPLAGPARGARELPSYTFPQIMRSHYATLAGWATQEYTFCATFFGLEGEALQTLFRPVLERAAAALLQDAEMYIHESFDPVNLLLLASLGRAFKEHLGRQGAPCLDKHFDTVEALVWPRLDLVLKAQAESVKAVAARRARERPSTKPHAMVRRFAQLSGALRRVAAGRGFGLLEQCLGRVKDDVDEFILTSGAEFAELKDFLVFAMNNYDVIVAAWGPHAPEQTLEIETKLKGWRKQYVEEIWTPFLGPLIDFVKRTEALLAHAPERIRVNPAAIQDMLTSFKHEWHAALERTLEIPSRDLVDPKSVTTAKQEVLQQFLVYHQRCLEILKKEPFSKQAWQDIIDKHVLVVDVKRFSGTVTPTS
eukprot:m.147631 g.147631  ORF g.147631 m.147631 type:complete len:844 (-) comp15044_c0_seq1:59-2590(-)